MLPVGLGGTKLLSVILLATIDPGENCLWRAATFNALILIFREKSSFKSSSFRSVSSASAKSLSDVGVISLNFSSSYLTIFSYCASIDFLYSYGTCQIRLERFYDMFCKFELVSIRLLSKFPPPPAWLPGTALALTLIWNGSPSSAEMSIFVKFDGKWYFVLGEVIGFMFWVDFNLSVEF